MGAKRVVLFGADFSFPEDVSHVAGSAAVRTVDTETTFHWVLNGYGKRIKTELNYRGFLRDFERYITDQAGIQFVNSSKKGALIQGTVPIEDVVL